MPKKSSRPKRIKPQPRLLTAQEHHILDQRMGRYARVAEIALGVAVVGFGVAIFSPMSLIGAFFAAAGTTAGIGAVRRIWVIARQFGDDEIAKHHQFNQELQQSRESHRATMENIKLMPPDGFEIPSDFHDANLVLNDSSQSQGGQPMPSESPRRPAPRCRFWGRKLRS